jgi:transcriptional regulator with XRE-family HTH domain
MRRRKPSRAEQYESAAFRGLQQCLASGVARLRKENGWTQAEAAHRCKMTTWQYQRIESGITNVTFTTLARLIDGFNVDIHTLFQDGDAAKFMISKSSARRKRSR